MSTVPASLRRISLPRFAMDRLSRPRPRLGDSPDPLRRRISDPTSGIATCAMSCFLCISLWISLAFAVWMSRGWIGLLFSGQLLSAGSLMFQKLAQRTHCAVAACHDTAGRWEGKRNVP
jgi:hypothetical protein